MEKERCFIITQIGNKNDDIRRHVDGIIDAVIKPVIEDEYEVVVSHQINEIGSINKQIIREIYNDKLVIANLTELNPNVMYELAFRHSVGKPVIVIAEEGTKLPFDVSFERTLFYKNDALGTLELQKDLKKFINNIDFNKTSSPIHEIIKEYNQETIFIQNYETVADKHNVDSLKYIIDRLNSIENLINNEVSIGKDSFPHSSATVIKFEDFDESIKDEDIIQVLEKAEKIDTNYVITEFSFNKKTKTLIIYELLKYRISIPIFISFYKEELTKLGFKGIKLDVCQLVSND